MVLKGSGKLREARAALCRSLEAWPWNWSAWVDLASLCPNRDLVRPLLQPQLLLRVDDGALQVESLPVPSHWLRDVWTLAVLKRVGAFDETYECARFLLQHFPGAPGLQEAAATALYEIRGAWMGVAAATVPALWCHMTALLPLLSLLRLLLLSLLQPMTVPGRRMSSCCPGTRTASKALINSAMCCLFRGIR